MANEGLAYCSRCDKYVKPDPGFECPICESSLRPKKEVLVASPEVIPEPVVEEILEEVPEEVEVAADTEFEADEVVSVEDLLNRG